MAISWYTISLCDAVAEFNKYVGGSGSQVEEATDGRGSKIRGSAVRAASGQRQSRPAPPAFPAAAGREAGQSLIEAAPEGGDAETIGFQDCEVYYYQVKGLRDLRGRRAQL
jgi:hypothetical protein